MEEVRKSWMNAKNEWDKLHRQLYKTNEAIKRWIVQREHIAQEIKIKNQEIERLRGRMLADCAE